MIPMNSCMRTKNKRMFGTNHYFYTFCVAISIISLLKLSSKHDIINKTKDAVLVDSKRSKHNITNSKKNETHKTQSIHRVEPDKTESISAIEKYITSKSDGFNINTTHKNQSINVDNDSPYYRAIIHVGPRKTGSTSIQRALLYQHRETLLEDNYFVPRLKNTTWGFNGEKKHAQFAMCLITDRTKLKFRCRRSFWLKLEKELALNNATKRHLLMSAEGLSEPSVNYQRLRSFLEPWRNVTIVAAYRRLHDWIPSLYNQKMKPMRYKKLYSFPSLEEWLTDSKWKEIMETYTVAIADRYRMRFNNVHIFNMHDSDDIVSDFLCHAIPNAHHSCAEAKESSNFVTNEAWDLEYFRLSLAALNGRASAKELTLTNITALVKYRQEVFLNLTIDDFPWRCLSQNLARRILDSSLDMERKLLPEWFASPRGEAELRYKFDIATRSKLCSIDLGKVLADEGWRDFFQSLNVTEMTEGSPKKNDSFQHWSDKMKSGHGR